MDLRNWEFYDNGDALVGATVKVRDAVLTHPNGGSVLSTTTTDSNGMWAFTGLTDTAKDVEVIWGSVSQYHKWYKGQTRHAVGVVFHDDHQTADFAQFVAQASVAAPGSGIGRLYPKTDGAWYTQYASNGEVKLAHAAHRVRVKKTASQSIADATNTTVTWNDENYDTSTMHDTATNNERLVSPIIGLARITVGLTIESNAIGFRAAAIRKNGATEIGGMRFPAVNNAATVLDFSVEEQVVANDYFEVRVVQTSGGALNIENNERNTYFAMSVTE